LPPGKESLEQNFLVTLLLLGFYLAIVSRHREITVLANRLEARIPREEAARPQLWDFFSAEKIRFNARP
jgi:hypothetical protein